MQKWGLGFSGCRLIWVEQEMIRVMGPPTWSNSQLLRYDHSKGTHVNIPTTKKLVKPQEIVGLFLQHITWGAVLLCITTDDDQV